MFKKPNRLTMMMAATILLCSALGSSLAVESFYTVSPEYASSVYYENLLAVELLGDGAEDIYNIASSQLGYCEGSYSGEGDIVENNVTEYNLWFFGAEVSGDDYAWCTTFVSWCARQARVNPSALPNFSYCSAAYTDALPRAGAIMHSAGDGYTPVRGDLIFFSSYGAITHVGIVGGSDGECVLYISGNDEHAVRMREIPLDSDNIHGYATPRYNMDLDPYSELFGNYPEPSRDIYYVEENMFYGDDVRWIQHCLAALGYEIDVDGYFGATCDGVVKAFQLEHFLTADGVVGQNTRAALRSYVLADATVIGDVNLDLNLNTGDAAHMLACLAGVGNMAPAALPLADFNGDEGFNTGDAASLLTHIANGAAL